MTPASPRALAALAVISMALGAGLARARDPAQDSVLPRFSETPRPLAGVTADQSRGYSVLDRSRGPSDELPSASLRVLENGPVVDFGANPDLARAVGKTEATRRGFLVPGRGVLCLADDAGAVTCNATTEAVDGELVLMFDLDGGSELLGVVPDGVRTVQIESEARPPIVVRVVRNGYYAALDAPVDGVSFVDAEGTHRLSIRSR